MLQLGILLGGSDLLVRHAEVGEDTLQLQARQLGNTADSLNGSLEVVGITLEAQAGHTGIQLDVALDLAAGGNSALRESLGGILAVDGLGNIVSDHHGSLIIGSGTQLQDGHLDAALAQLNALIHVGNSQITSTQLLQDLAHLNRTVTVGICLHNTHELGSAADMLAQSLIVVGQGIQIDLCPSSTQCTLHNIHTLSYKFQPKAVGLLFSPPDFGVSDSTGSCSVTSKRFHVTSYTTAPSILISL